tara:strand:+ start:2425 stop:2619 length:195 start_codon:yes stop_codon:yes gene_type:complete
MPAFKRGELCSLVDGSVVIILDEEIKTINYGTEQKRYIKVSSLCDKILSNNHIDVTFLVKIPQE